MLDGGVGVEVEVGVGREWREGGVRGLEKERVREDDRARLGFCCFSFFVELQILREFGQPNEFHVDVDLSFTVALLLVDLQGRLRQERQNQIRAHLEAADLVLFKLICHLVRLFSFSEFLK